MSTSRAIRTKAGELVLTPATIDQLRGIARCWSMGVLARSDDPASYGLVFQRGVEEAHGIKLQPADLAEADARAIHHMNRALIASALPHYLEKRHRGVMVPCAYYREKSAGKVESGVAIFVGPDPAERSTSGTRSDDLYDARLGPGATAMVFDMAGALAAARDRCGFPAITVIGVELRPRLALGRLALHFLVHGPQVFVIKDPLQDEEPVWEYVVRAGFSALPYVPMKPMAIPGESPSQTPRA